MDLAGTVTLSDPRALASLVSALHRCGCDVEQTGGSRLAFVFPWGSPETNGSLLNAWREIVFFLRAWQIDHPTVEAEVENIRFVQSDERVPQTSAA